MQLNLKQAHLHRALVKHFLTVLPVSCLITAPAARNNQFSNRDQHLIEVFFISPTLLGCRAARRQRSVRPAADGPLSSRRLPEAERHVDQIAVRYSGTSELV